MGIKFNADEIFEIAEKIETNGAHFYQSAAGKFSDANVKQLFSTLADMENQHKLIFSIMRDELSPKEKKPVSFDPENQTKDYLQAMADGHVFDINADPEKYLSNAHSPMEILKIAMGFEKDSIAFYLGIKAMIPQGTGREKIERIIHEEMYHITVLSQEMAKIR